jgi:hypothetical protein
MDLSILKKKRTNSAFLVVGILVLGLGLLIAFRAFSIGRQIAIGEISVAPAVTYGVGIVFSLCMFFLVWFNSYKLRALEQRQAWLINVVNWNVRQLRDHGLDRVMEAQQILPEADLKNVPPQWPWGKHHTEYLGHLEAAARKWWNLYDPSDPTTAPTNEMVSDWLQSERNISGEKARAIASMLRPDGLRTGPRK